MRRSNKTGLSKSVTKEFEALKNNGNGFFQIKCDTEDDIERLKARLVACGNKRVLGVKYGITFAAVIDMSSVKKFLIWLEKWKVSDISQAKHGDVPDPYVKADNKANLGIYIPNPQEMLPSRRTHQPTMGYWRLAKRTAMYLLDTKKLRLSMLDIVMRTSLQTRVTDNHSRMMCKKGVVSLSTMKAKFTAASIMARDILGVRELLQELN
ncbi:hypothetical protein DD237_006742 [Peronospora effusa]|uniref:Uncharacterized protein n=1 Tax=Peronospora effusa TaxID=542832 RepID=A0A3R7Y0C1_9STRA|nr:hypothetical protein DD237_006742 [Peronospora effusa]